MSLWKRKKQSVSRQPLEKCDNLFTFTTSHIEPASKMRRIQWQPSTFSFIIHPFILVIVLREKLCPCYDIVFNFPSNFFYQPKTSNCWKHCSASSLLCRLSTGRATVDADWFPLCKAQLSCVSRWHPLQWQSGRELSIITAGMACGACECLCAASKHECG